MSGGTDATHLALADAEDQHGRAEWEAAAAEVLRKARRLSEDDPDARAWEELTHTTLDGINLSPLGTPELLDELHTTGRPTRAGAWDIRVRAAGADATAVNEAALVDLDGGVTSLWVHARDGADLATLLSGVLLDLAPVVLDSERPRAAAEALLAVAEDHGVDLHPGTNFAADPVGAAVRSGTSTGADDDLVATAELARSAGVRGVVVDATAVHDLGASDAQELGYALAVAATYLRTLAGAGIGVEEAADLIEFRFAATDEQFPTIAKLRAARRLWARMLELSGATTDSTTAQPTQHQHVVTSSPMMTRYDPYVNMLRGTVAAFAAGVGGADAVTVLPFDSTLGEPDAFGRRIARNVSHLLIEESHLAAVADPAGGSYAVEKLTEDLAVAGWAELDRIETAGGIEAVLADGSLHSRIDAVAERRDTAIARRERAITGLTEYPDLAEVLPERSGAPFVGGVRSYGAAFEALRDDTPVDHVFLATLGPVAQHTARASFATNLLAAGGIDVDVAGVSDGVDALLAAYDGQPVACLAGADATYAEWGAEAVAALRDAGVRHVIIAGKPTALADEGSVDDSCAMGVDALDFLRRTREAMA